MDKSEKVQASTDKKCYFLVNGLMRLMRESNGDAFQTYNRKMEMWLVGSFLNGLVRFNVKGKELKNDIYPI